MTSGSKIQSILFKKKYWTENSSYNWLLRHNLYPIKPAHLYPNFIRYRLVNPDKFKYFITKKIDNGINLVIGFK